MKSITISGQSSSLHPSIKMLSLKSTKKLAFPKRLIIEQRTSSTWILHVDERATSDVGRHENRAECLGPCRCMCVLVSGLMWDGATWKYSLASEWRRQKHKERAMKVICLVMNGAHHLRVHSRETQKKRNTNKQMEMVVHVIHNFFFQFNDNRAGSQTHKWVLRDTHISMRLRTSRSSFSAATSKAWTVAPGR